MTWVPYVGRWSFWTGYAAEPGRLKGSWYDEVPRRGTPANTAKPKLS